MTFKAEQRVSYKGMEMPAKVISGPHASPGADRYLIEKADGNVTLAAEQMLTALPSRRETLALEMYNATSGVHYNTLSSLRSTYRETYLRLADAALASLGAFLAPEDAEGGFWVQMSADQAGALHYLIANAVSGPPNGLRSEMEKLHGTLSPLVRAHDSVAKAHALARQTMTRRPGGSLGVHFQERP